MKTKEVKLESKKFPGLATKARLVQCDCGSEAFNVLLLFSKAGTMHPHLQCVDCETTYCSGGCPGPGQVATPPSGTEDLPWPNQ